MASFPSEKVYSHGDNRRYTFNQCRCPECGEAHTRAARDRRRAIAYGTHRGYVDATGVIRRIRALVADGHSGRHIAQYLDVDPSWIRALYRGVHLRVHEDTRELFVELYRRHKDTSGPSDLARLMGERRGWAHPADWDGVDIDNPDALPNAAVVDDRTLVDWIAVERALGGDPVRLTRLERHYAVHAGHAKGMNFTTVARALRMSATRARELGNMPLPKDIEVAA